MLNYRGYSAHLAAETCYPVRQWYSSRIHILLHRCGFLLLFLLASHTLLAAETVDFSLPDIQGKQQKLTDYRGKWVVVNYWATWCPPCVTEIPELIAFHEAHKNKDAVVIGVNFEDIELPPLREFVDSYFISYPVVRMNPAPRSQLGAISGLPTSFLISPAGVLLAQQTGPVTAKMIEEFIAEQNAEASAAAKAESTASTAGKQNKSVNPIAETAATPKPTSAVGSANDQSSPAVGAAAK